MILIDKDSLKFTDFEIAMCGGDFQKAFKLLCEKLDDAPTVDAVEVVRCKDCRFHEHEELGIVWCPNVVGSWIAEDGYCSMGERREDGGTD